MLVVMVVLAVAGSPRSAEAAPAADTAAASLTVTVSLSPALAKKAAPNDVVFIFARAAQGPRMPLAIVRKQVKDLPATVVLDDSNGMSTDMKLSSAPEVIVVARVSKSGMANAQNGDLEGMSAPLKAGTKAVTISIAKELTEQKTPVAPHLFR
jgi:cytochrome c-type biogenesis protein CcmH